MSSFPFTLGVMGSIFPLSGNPYWSRTTYSEMQNDPVKNYFMLGFKPGQPLQASELNEIQEIHFLNQSLYAAMYSSWPIYLPSHVGKNPIFGPGWEGTTPLYPEYDNVNTFSNMVETTGDNNETISIYRGWYLVSVKSSKFKHWIYLNTDYKIEPTSYKPFENQPMYFGFTASYEIIKPTADPSLYDNSSGTTIPVSGAPAGADRVTLKISEPFWTNNINTPHFSPIIKKLDTDVKDEYIHLYMNNVPVPGA